MHSKLTANKPYAQRMSRWRKSTVEPVLGTLINFLNMRRINTRGIELANKHVLMAALCYNLKKYLKSISRKSVIKTMAMQTAFSSAFLCRFIALFRLRSIQVWLISRRYKLVFSEIENP
jgi:uncharacterized membrane protein